MTARGRHTKRILVCLDDSPRAPGVLAAAAELALRTGARMSLLRTVTIPPELRKVSSVELRADVLETLENKAQAELDELAIGIPEDSLEGVHVYVGPPSVTICREADELDVDVVVVGAHGYGTLDRLLGTTAANVVNHCDRSVLVVRARPEPAVVT
jgi:universal stress protein F